MEQEKSPSGFGVERATQRGRQMAGLERQHDTSVEQATRRDSFVVEPEILHEILEELERLHDTAKNPFGVVKGTWLETVLGLSLCALAQVRLREFYSACRWNLEEKDLGWFQAELHASCSSMGGASSSYLYDRNSTIPIRSSPIFLLLQRLGLDFLHCSML